MKKAVMCIVLVLVMVPGIVPAASAGGYAPIDFTDEEAAAANLFLSNFTEVGVAYLDSYPSDMDMVDFAHDHLWFNSNGSYQYGEYFNENNCRVSDDRIQEIVDKYFYYRPKRVDLSATRFDYKDGYYYHCETGGWINSGFAHVVSISPMGEDMYYMAFLIFGDANYWDNSVMSWSIEEIEAQYGEYAGYGAACVYAADLSDRSTYKIVSFARLR